MPHLVSREPWPLRGIEHYATIDDGEWGYLLVYEGGKVTFDREHRPTNAEIIAHWGHCLKEVPSPAI